jgi:hypothetical protein
MNDALKKVIFFIYDPESFIQGRVVIGKGVGELSFVISHWWLR